MIHELRDGDVVMIGIDVNHEGDEMGRAIREALEQMTGVIVVETLGDVVMIGIDVNHEGDEMGRAIREALEQMTGVKLAGVIVVETLQGAFVFRGKRRST